MTLLSKMHPFYPPTSICGCWLDCSAVLFCSLHPLIVSHYHHVLPIFHSGASSLARGACVILKIAFTKYLPSTRKKNETRSQIRVCWQFMHFDTMTFVVRLPSSFSEGVWKMIPSLNMLPNSKCCEYIFLDATLLLSLNWYVFFENKYW